MKREFIFLGPPACGKGTQTDKLAKYLNLPHIDTGSLLRAEIQSGSADGEIAKKFIDKGQLVPVDLVGNIIKNRLAQPDCENGYILDGYPRSVEQANKLDAINRELGNANIKAIYFDMDHDILISRIVNRRSCPACGAIYNLLYHPTSIQGICDVCNRRLIQRKDDNEETAEARFETYFRETAPLIEYYKHKNVLLTLDANGTIEEVWQRLLKLIEA